MAIPSTSSHMILADDHELTKKISIGLFMLIAHGVPFVTTLQSMHTLLGHTSLKK